MFLSTDDFRRDYNDMVELGINFVRGPKKADYGTVAVFEDLYGNLWDLVEFDPDHLCRDCGEIVEKQVRPPVPSLGEAVAYI